LSRASLAAHNAGMAETPNPGCSCAKCASYCTHKPGWFHPDQIAPLAKALRLSIAELFRRHLAIDWWAGDDLTGGKDVFVLSPRLEGAAGGDMFPGDPHGACHWFRDGKCQIHTLGKPAECAFAGHDVSEHDSLRNHLAMVAAWAPHQHRIEKMLGRPPSAAPLQK
jgi:hypothetical protein